MSKTNDRKCEVVEPKLFSVFILASILLYNNKNRMCKNAAVAAVGLIQNSCHAVQNCDNIFLHGYYGWGDSVKTPMNCSFCVAVLPLLVLYCLLHRKHTHKLFMCFYIYTMEICVKKKWGCCCCCCVRVW